MNWSQMLAQIGHIYKGNRVILSSLIGRDHMWILDSERAERGSAILKMITVMLWVCMCAHASSRVLLPLVGCHRRRRLGCIWRDSCRGCCALRSALQIQKIMSWQIETRQTDGPVAAVRCGASRPSRPGFPLWWFFGGLLQRIRSRHSSRLLHRCKTKGLLSSLYLTRFILLSSTLNREFNRALSAACTPGKECFETHTHEIMSISSPPQSRSLFLSLNSFKTVI